MEPQTNPVQNFFSVQCLPHHSARKKEANRAFQTYCVKLEYIDDVDHISNLDSFHLQAILFDQKYKKFVGSCWKGKPTLLKNKKINFNQRLYFYSSIPGKELLLVVELCIDSDSSKSIGWMCTPLIEEDETTFNLDHLISYKFPLLHGTPLALLTLNGGTKDFKSKEYKTGMELSFSLMPYPLMLQTAHLVPENILIDASDHIPGLISDSVDITSHVSYTFKPRLQKCVTYVFSEVCIRVQPSVEEFEKIILERIVNQQLADCKEVSPLKAKIVQRRIQVGVHNGYTFIQECDLYHLLVEPIVTPKAQKSHHRSSSMGSINYSRENGLTLRSDVKIPNVPDNPNVVFVFLVEYTISLPNTSSDQSNMANSLSKSPTSNIAVGWGYVKLGNLKLQPSHTVPLTCDSNATPYELLFLRTTNDFELSFSVSPEVKQGRITSAGQSTAGDCGSVASFSTKTYVSPETSYLHSPAVSVSVLKHKSAGDIPTSVARTEVGFSKDYQDFRESENLALQNSTLQEVTFIPSSLPLVPPVLHSFPIESTSSFKTFSKMYWDKLQPILDHNGKPATVINLPYSIDKELEFSCPPQQNECTLHFIAISGLEEVPSEIFFTFQFYRFLPVRTESLTLKPLSENADLLSFAMVYALLKLRNSEKSPGFMVTYHVNPSELGPGETKPFLQYLMKHTLHIDLWNGQSLLYYGSVLLPLKYLCRQGKDATIANLELDIINCEFPDESLSKSTVSPIVAKGKLHLRLSNIRHPLSIKSLEKLGDYSNSETVVISPKTEMKDMSRVSTTLVSKARPIIETDRELTRLLSSRCLLHNSKNSTHMSDERRRKLARMEAVLNVENERKIVKPIADDIHNFLKEREQDLLTIDSYILKNKTEMIQSLLHSSVTFEKPIYPVIGNKLFFEFVLENPFQEPKKINISWKCQELSIVKDVKMWQALRTMHGLSLKIEHLVFDGGDSLLLQPMIKVHIPFVYCSTTAQFSQMEVFKTVSSHHFTSDLLSSAPMSCNLVPNSVKVRFMTEEQVLLAVLLLHIQPLPPSSTHIFKFLSMEHSVFKKCIRIDSDFSRSRKLTVSSSDASVACCVQEPQDWEEDVNIHVKTPTKAAGKFREFYLFLYKDSYQICATQVWCMMICPVQRIDLSCISGQLMRSSLLIRGTHATSLVRCFSSSSDLQLHPSEPFLLSPFAIHELSMNVRSLLPGIKHFQVSMVNQSLELVLQSWLLVLTCQKPTVSKAFQVHLSSGKEAIKRITYANPYNEDRQFVLHSSHPHVVRLRENRFVVDAGKSHCIGIHFLPQEHILTETIFLYMNDMEDKNEETYCIKVICQ